MSKSIIFVCLSLSLNAAAQVPNQHYGPSSQNEPITLSHEFERKPKPSDVISGVCVVIPGGGNLMATPCTDLILTLTAGKGKDPISTRTDHDGSFQFTVERGVNYTVQPGSKFYEVVSPTGPISAMLNLEIRLRQK